MSCLVVFGLLFFLCTAQDASREPKFFFGYKPQTVVKYRQISEIVTEFTPSSCFVMEPSLPPCRHVRSLELYPSAPTRITRTESPQIKNFQAEGEHYSRYPAPSRSSESYARIPTPPMRYRPQPLKTHSHYWGWNLFNPFRIQNVTFTETKTEYITTRIEDPHTVVSFHIKGCRPSVLPFSLSECYKPEVVLEENKSIIVMAPLKFIPSFEKVDIPSYKNLEKWEVNTQMKNKEDEKKSLEIASTEDFLTQTTESEGNTQKSINQMDSKEYGNSSQSDIRIQDVFEP